MRVKVASCVFCCQYRYWEEEEGHNWQKLQ